MINERDYQGGVDKDIEFFVGTEVEKSPAYGMKTLFVVGPKSSTEIIDLAKTHDCQHVYFGANQSFDLHNDDYDGWQVWEKTIIEVMDAGYLSTLDLALDQVEGLLDSSLCEYNDFIPMISVKLPYTKLLNYNTTVKIDDIGFNRTNPGVWCWSLRDLMERDRFTDWRAYQQDQPIKVK